MDDLVPIIHNNSGTTQEQHSLMVMYTRQSVEDLECDLNHLSVGLDIQEGMSQQHRVLLWVAEVIPYLLYIVSVGENAMLDSVLKSWDATLALGLITQAVLLFHAYNDALVSGVPDSGHEYILGGGGGSHSQQREICISQSHCHTSSVVSSGGGGPQGGVKQAL